MSIEALAAEVKIQEAAVEHSRRWLYNFQVNGKDSSIVLQHEGFLRDTLSGTIVSSKNMKEIQLQILKTTQAVLVS